MRPMKPRPPGSAHDALARLLAEIAESRGRDPEAGPKLAADFEQKSVSLFHKATDPESDVDLGFRRVARLTEHFRAGAAADYLARLAGGLFIPLPPEDGASRWPALAALAAEEFGQAIADAVRALSDKAAGRRELSAAEASKLSNEIIDVIRVLTELLSIAIDIREGATS